MISPESEREAVAAVTEAIAAGKTITPRGGGTGLAGAALGRGYVVNCSRLTDIINISMASKTVTCGSGIIYKELNLALKEHGLFFPPDPSSGDSCQIGGMLANNSSGPRSVKYGLTSHYVEELKIIAPDGNTRKVRKLKLDSDELTTFLKAYPEYGQILKLLQENRELILARWPALKKNSAGYNLYQVVKEFNDGIFNIPALYVGSEGTLGLILEVTLRLCELPRESKSFGLFFDSLEDAGRSVEPILATGPSALEIIDGATMNLIGREKHGLPLQAEAMLLLDYEDDPGDKEKSLRKLVERVQLSAPLASAVGEDKRSELWAARRAIVPILYRHHDTRRPLALIEDASLPIKEVPAFIAWIRDYFERENLTFGLFGHIGDGNLHIRPLLDVNNEDEFKLARKIYNDVYARILQVGGASTAEHGDGRLRAPILPDLYGPELYDLFVEVKNILDPQGWFNPDVIISKRPFTDDIDFKKLELTCAACGKCNGYCPAAEIFRGEDYSARGWLRMLKLGRGNTQDYERFLKFCLNCKNCSTVCPAGVDIAAEILDYKAAQPHPTAGRIISLFDRRKLFEILLKVGSVFDPLMKTALGKQITALVGRAKFGFDKNTELPQPAFKTLRRRFPENCLKTSGVAYFHGCADNYFVSGAGDALIEVMDHYRIETALPDQQCCGLPMEVYGHRDNLIQKAKYNIDALEGYEAVVFSCASCLHRLADYPELFDEDSEYHSKALALREKVFDISQYLLQAGVELPVMTNPTTITYHHPCHLRAAGLEKEPLRLLDKIDGLELLHPELAGRCCGQAGSFGYLHHQEGRAIFAAKKAEYEKMGAETIVSSCPSCIGKVRQEMGEGVRVCHPIEILADLIGGRGIDEHQ
ncbi:MAG: FAD-binding protein [FCB group bacterium]|nr:FAD-binding protein [FCB group bacterium]